MNTLFCRDMTGEGFAAFNMVALLIHKPVKFHNKTCQSCPASQQRFGARSYMGQWSGLLLLKLYSMQHRVHRGK